MADDVTITVNVRDLTGPGFQSVTRNLNQLQHQANQMGGSLRIVGGQLNGLAGAATSAGNAFGGGGGSGMGLKGQMIGVGAAIGTTLLPTIGALSPMLFGLAAVGGAAALAMDDLKKEAKKLKPEFEQLQKVASKAIMPAVKRSMDDWRGAMKGLQPVVKEGGKAFGDFVEKAADFANSPAFKSSLLTNVKMGTEFFGDFTDSLLDFTQAFLDFGTKSQPSLDAFQNLLGGLLDTGLPGMFRELEQGIEGSSEFLNGIASFINDSLLPSLGKLAGSFADTFGPFLGELLIGAGKTLEGFATVFDGAMQGLEPLMKVVTDGLRAMSDIAEIGVSVLGSLGEALGGALLETLAELAGIDAFDNLNRDFTTFSDWVQTNQTAIRSAFVAIAAGIIDMVNAGVQMMPILTNAFTGFAIMAIKSIDMFITALAVAFSGIPGVGDMFKDLSRNFDDASKGWLDDLGAMRQGVEDFANTAGPKLSRAKLVLNADQAKENLAAIKEQLKDPELTKERRAKLTADKKDAEAALREARGDLAAFDKKQATAKLNANSSSFWNAVRAATGAKIPTKTGRVTANTDSFWGRVQGLVGRVLGTSYVDVKYRQSEANNQPKFQQADGGIMRFYANGGTEQHVAQIAPAGSWRVWGEPETGGESYIPLAPGKRTRSRQVAEETVGILGGEVQWFAKGGLTDAEKSARAGLRSQFGINRFGRMAGWSQTSFEKSLGSPQDMSSLVGALSEIRTSIRAATRGATESRLLRQLDSAARGLVGYEKSLSKVTASLEKARGKLDDLKNSASQLRDSVRSGVMSSANITRGASGSGPMTVAGIMGGLTASRDKATAFADALSGLKAKGLDKGLLQQIAEAGIEGGGLETAGALLGASSSEIGSLNSLQAQIAKAATAAGATTADAVYGAAIRAQEKLVASLRGQQAKLEAAMDRLAKAMEKAISRAIGGKASGGIVGAASGGARGGLTWVGEQGPELVRMPYGSRVYSNPDSRRMAAAGGALSSQPIVIQVRIADRDFGELWVDTGQKQVRARGSIEATLKPPRGR